MIDAYKIGVRIAMSSNAAAVLGTIQKDLFGLHKAVDLTTGKLNAMKIAAVGAMGVIAGGAALSAMAKLVEHGREFVHQQALMKAAGMDQKEVAEATTRAWQTTRDVLGTSVTENMQSVRELRMVFGSTQEAIDRLTAVSKAQMVMNTVRGKGSGDQVFDMAKALEIKGVSMDPVHFETMLNGMVAAGIASGGRVLGSDFLSAFKYGRTATQGWSDDFVKLILPTLIQEMKGGGFGGSVGGPGNALQSAFQAVVGGTMSNTAAEEFYKLGLLDAHKIIFTRTGNIKGIRPGGVKGSAEFEVNPYQWVQEVLVPALAAKHITSPEAVREEIAHMFVNRTAQQIMTMFVTQQQRFEKDAELISKAGGTNTYSQLIKEDPTARIKAFTEAWQNLLTSLGAPLVDPAMHMLDSLTANLNRLTAWASQHPETVRIIGEVAAGLAAMAVALGTIAIGTAAAAAMAALIGPTGFIVLVGGAAIAAAAGLERLEHALDNLLPDWLKVSVDPNGRTALQNIHEHGIVRPWWWPSLLGGSSPDALPGPDLNLNHYLFNNRPHETHVTVNLDGQQIAHVVTQHQERAATQPPTSTSLPDTRVGPSYPMPGWAW